MAFTKARQQQEERWVPTVCNSCYCNCTIQIKVVNGVMRQVAGVAEAPPNFGKICAKSQAQVAAVYNPHRLLHPMIRTNPKKGLDEDPGWRRISWDEALDIIQEKLARIHQQDPRKLAILTFDTESMVPIRAFVSAFGTPNFTAGPAGYFCGNGVHSVAYIINGSIDYEADLKHTKHVLLFGSQYGFVFMSHAMGAAQDMSEARRNGTRVTVIDPVMSNAAAKADEWLPIRPGTDAALALGMSHLLLNEYGIYDAEFLRRYTNAPYLIGEDGEYVRDPESGQPLVWNESKGTAEPYHVCPAEEMALDGNYECHGGAARPSLVALREHLKTYTPEYVAQVTTVPADTVRRLAREFGEAARIGDTIEIDGQTLPYRPAVAHWSRGISQHKHSMHNGLAMAILNAVVGNIDMPGGLLNANSAGPFGFPKEGLDGLLTKGNPYSHMRASWPPQEVSKPKTMELVELFPLSVYARAVPWLSILESEKYRAEYMPEMLIQCRTNIVATSADQDKIIEAMKAIPFVVSFSDHMNETACLADIVLPDANNLERLAPFASDPYTSFRSTPAPGEDWWFAFQQPVCPPRGESRYWVEVLYELAKRIGIQRDVCMALNTVAHLEAPHQLNPDQDYQWEEICDIWARSRTDGKAGLEEFKKNGYVTIRRRTVAESYPRSFHTGRIPLYMEHFPRIGREVAQVTGELGIPWDVSGYKPLISWMPCPAYENKDKNALFLVNTKLAFYSQTVSAENALLNDIIERMPRTMPVQIHPETAKRLGIENGQRVRLETPEGLMEEATVMYSEGVHPEALACAGILGRKITGNPKMRGKGVHYNKLIAYDMDRMDYLSAAVDACVKVYVRPVASGQ